MTHDLHGVYVQENERRREMSEQLQRRQHDMTRPRTASGM